MTRADAVVLALALLLVGALYAHFWQAPRAATAAEIRSGGRLVGRYPLAQTRQLAVSGRIGVSRILIEPGRARFADSPCRNRICVHSGWLTHAGDATACLPNGVSLSLSGDTEDALDAIAQ